MRRKQICLLTATIESGHGRNILSGAVEQCRRYGYDLSVYSSLVTLDSNDYDKYRLGERDIYDLPDYGSYDGIILDTITLSADLSGGMLVHINEMLLEHPEVPVVCVGTPFGGYPTISGSDEYPLREMCRHVAEFHGRKDICIITGSKGHPEAEKRLEVFVDELERLGIETDSEHIYYGDFWYGSGMALAKEIVSGKRHKPEAVLSASEHMALGLIEELTRNGVRVPEDIIVVSFDAALAGLLEEVSLSAFDSNFKKTAADAVDQLRSVIEPESELSPYQPEPDKMFRAGMSCGCISPAKSVIPQIRDHIYYTERNYNDEKVMNEIDIGLLMEKYIPEAFAECDSFDECFENIYNYSYLLFPYLNFYMFLREDWIDPDADVVAGYPEKMRLAVTNSTVNGLSFHKAKQSVMLDTGKILPFLTEHADRPSVYYFTAVHFKDKMFGCAVIQRDINDEHLVNIVYRTWFRMVNNGLEMVRVRNRYLLLSTHDKMTGLYNRRGMYLEFDRLKEQTPGGSSIFVSVIDMDGLKYINDLYGHIEGDFGLMLLAEAVQRTAGANEICVRAGGDEFYIIGVDRYPETEPEDRIVRFYEMLSALSEKSEKEYPVSASIGCALGSSDASLEDLLNEADEKMYKHKMKRKKQRQ